MLLARAKLSVQQRDAEVPQLAGGESLVFGGRGARLQQEFQRTASRLIEMQTAAYLARSRRG